MRKKIVRSTIGHLVSAIDDELRQIHFYDAKLRSKLTSLILADILIHRTHGSGAKIIKLSEH